MHEMSLCESIREIVIEQSRQNQFKRVNVLRLEVGRFACVEPAAMEFAFDVVMRNSPAENARLEIVELPATANCFKCGLEQQVERRTDRCSNCGSGQLLPQGGEELRIKDMEVE